MMLRIRFGLRVGLVVGLALCALPLRMEAAVITLFVSSMSGSDANTCTSAGSPCKTIGHAISLAGSGDTINVAAGSYTTPNETFPLTISQSLTIVGAGATSTVIDAVQTNRVISVNGTAAVSISGVTIQGGSTPGVSNGGGILDNSTGTLTLTDCIVTGNHADSGGGIAEEGGGIVNLTNCTVSNNTADDNGGGIVEDGGGTINLSSCTVSGNTSTIDGGGIAEEGSGTVNLINCTVSGNSSVASGGGTTFGGGIAGDGGGIINANNVTISNNRATTGGGIANNSGDEVNIANTIVGANPQGGDCNGSITSEGHNLDSDDTCGLNASIGDVIAKNPLLGPLQLNAPGSTATQALIAGSPAIDAGNPGPTDGVGDHCEPTDQRGVTRPQGPICDIGAFEGQIAPPATSAAPALDAPALLLVTAGLVALGARRLRYH
jgi:parallel beta-helix repeat protein